jgi:Tfp pilus assembly protein PilN
MIPKPLNLEFAPHARRITLANQVWLAVCGLILGWSLWALVQSLTEHARQAQQVAALGSAPANQARASTLPLRHDPLDLAKAQFVRNTVRSINAPWVELLAALEATPANVALLSVEPSNAKRSVTLTAEAGSPEHMLAYLRQLQSDPRLHEVMLVSHQTQTQAPGTPLRFQLEGRWGDGP